MIMLEFFSSNCPLDLPFHIILLGPVVEHVVHVGLCMVDTLPADGSHVVGLQEEFGSLHTPIVVKDVKEIDIRLHRKRLQQVLVSCKVWMARA